MKLVDRNGITVNKGDILYNAVTREHEIFLSIGGDDYGLNAYTISQRGNLHIRFVYGTTLDADLAVGESGLSSIDLGKMRSELKKYG